MKKQSLSPLMLLLTSFVFNTQRAEAAAITYTFDDYRPTTTIASSFVLSSGFFKIEDADFNGEVNFATELTDFKITNSASGLTDVTMNLVNSPPAITSLTGVTVDGSTLDFSGATGGALCISLAGGCGIGGDGSNDSLFYLDNLRVNQAVSNTNNFNDGQFNLTRQEVPLLAFASPTTVPFGVSPDLGILLLGGMYGASRLRKTVAARKQISNQEV